MVAGAREDAVQVLDGDDEFPPRGSSEGPGCGDEFGAGKAGASRLAVEAPGSPASKGGTTRRAPCSVAASVRRSTSSTAR